MTETFYIDSNIFIFPVIYDNEQSFKAGNILSRLEKNEIIGYTSVLTWDEVVYVIRKTLGKADSISIGKKFINYPNLRFINTDVNIIIKAMEIGENYNLKPRDSLHIATSLSRDIRNIISDDSDLDSVDIIHRIKL